MSCRIFVVDQWISPVTHRSHWWMPAARRIQYAKTLTWQFSEFGGIECDLLAGVFLFKIRLETNLILALVRLNALRELPIPTA